MGTQQVVTSSCHDAVWVHCIDGSLQQYGHKRKLLTLLGGIFMKKMYILMKNGILLPKLFWPTVTKNCSSDWEKCLKFEAEGREFAKILRSLEQFVWTVKG